MNAYLSACCVSNEWHQHYGQSSSSSALTTSVLWLTVAVCVMPLWRGKHTIQFSLCDNVFCRLNRKNTVKEAAVFSAFKFHVPQCLIWPIWLKRLLWLSAILQIERLVFVRDRGSGLFWWAPCTLNKVCSSDLQWLCLLFTFLHILLRYLNTRVNSKLKCDFITASLFSANVKHLNKPLKWPCTFRFTQFYYNNICFFVLQEKANTQFSVLQRHNIQHKGKGINGCRFTNTCTAYIQW